MCKFGRKFTSALLALALFVSLLPLGAAPAQAEGLTIKINSDLDLWNFAYELSKNTPGYANANVSLEGDIDVAISSWVPIGTNYLPSMGPITFTGTFDGNGHTIENINIIDEEKTTPPGVDPGPADYRFSADVGLFAHLGSGGTVKNLKVTGSVSGIVGLNSGSVTDCTNSGGVSGSGNVGGVVGQNNSSVTDCTNTSGFIISGSDNNFGGVVGNNSGTVENCSNSGSFSVPAPGAGSDTSGGNLGGVVGQNSGAGARITSCYNTGDLLNYTDLHPKVFFNGNLGGVVGNNTDNSSVTNCYSTGNIGSNDKPFPVQGIFGGVVGSNSDNSSVTNCYTTGKFGKYIDGTVGGVVGSNVDTSSVTDCYFLQQDPEISGIGSGETTGATAVSDLTDPKKFQGWDFANIWRISQSLNRPVLQENAQDDLPPGLGTADSPYRISTAEQLKSFRDIVNGEDGTADSNPTAHAELMNDIDLSSICNETNPWEPIGNGGGTSGGNTFEGYFDGQGHSVKNLVVGL